MGYGSRKTILVGVLLVGFLLAASLVTGPGSRRAHALLAHLRGATRGISGAVAGNLAGPVLVDAAKGVNHAGEGRLEHRKNGTLVWGGAYFGIGEAMNWSAYDYVELTLYNSSASIISFTFEVKDQGSDSYWTRVNQPQVLGPGLQTVKLPTRLRVGEPARPGRALDVSRVTSLILSRADEKDHAEVEVRSIVLKKSEDEPVPPGALAFDVGPVDTAVFDGFQALTEKSDYDSARGWGWVEKKLWAPYSQANRLFGPERLTADNLTIASGKLRFDVKPGRYKVWMIIDHPGGFWGEFPYFHHRSVRAQGKAMIDEVRTPRQSEDAYFAWEDREDHEGDDLFEQYWDAILREKSFDTVVGKDGHLDLEFDNEGCPGQVSCFGIALSALAILPSGTPEAQAAAASWLKRVHERRHAEFHDQFKQSTQALSALLKSLPAGLQVRNAPVGLDLSLASPSDLSPFGAHAGPAVPRVTAFRNSRAVFAPVVSWKSEKPRTISWRVEGLPADIPVEGGWIKFRALRDSYTGNLYSIRERWVTDEKERVFTWQDLGRLWLRFPVGSDARPGLYPATLVVSAGGAGESTRVPFELRVLKGAAANLDFPVGPFSAHIQENWWDPGFLRDRLLVLEEQGLRKLRALGLTTFSFSPQIGVRLVGEGASLDTREVDRVMALATKLGFQALVGYDAVFKGESLCGSERDSKLADPARFRQVVDELESRAKAHGWLPLTLVVCDEPVGDDLVRLVARLKGMGLADPEHKRRVQWSVTTSLGSHASPEDRELVSEVSLPFLQGYAKSDLRFPWVYYNDASRKTLGLRMFDLRESSDLRYRITWAWNVNTANPYFSLDGREDDIAWCSSTEAARLRCTVELDRVVDAGVTDYRIALALKQTLGSRSDLSSALKARGQALLEEARSDGVEADAWRAKVGEYLEGL